MSDVARLSYPRLVARTRRFTLGEPRDVQVSSDGSRVMFLRSWAGDDPVNALWVLDVASGEERCVADPRQLLTEPGEDSVPAEERARRERARELAGGIVSYATDAAATMAAFALAGRLYVADLVGGAPVRHVDTEGSVFDPRPDPTGRRVAFVAGPVLRVVEATGDRPCRELAGEPEIPSVTWGSAEFVAAEEMGRTRGYWWSPDGELLAVARVDTDQVPCWYVADPARPAVPPTPLRYPVAGTDNAEVRLWLVGLDGSREEIRWLRDVFPYLLDVQWREGEPLTIVVQTRDQRRAMALTVDGATAATLEQGETADTDWIDVIPGSPRWLSEQRLARVADDADVDTRRLLVAGEPASPAGLQVRGLLDVEDDAVLVAASDDPLETHVWRIGPGAEPERLSTEPGVHQMRAAGGVRVLRSSGLDHDGVRTMVHRPDGSSLEIASHALDPGDPPEVELLELGERRLRAGLVLPRGRALDSSDPLPVLVDSYGGPHVQRVMRARGLWREPQWLADQGFAVLVVDGRGTPGRGPAWERGIRFDLAGPVLEDQVDALHALAADRPGLDLARVGIRGWSFGGFLAALAVLRRPDVFHAAVAGAPVTDWRLYDTHYTERYLGHPLEQPEAYDRSSLLGDAAGLERPLLLLHGLVDDNVAVAHTLRLSQLLLEAGRPHTVLPLSGVTHLAREEEVAENVLLLQVEFLKRSLGVP